MSNGFYIFFAGVFGSLVAYITAKLTIKGQLTIARQNADKDITLQRDRLQDEREKSELSIERGKLDVLHRTLSKVALENSQTMSYMQSDARLSVADFRTRYLDNCERLHEAMAIADIYYPKMSESVREIYAQSNLFWGYQENLLRVDIKENPSSWESNLKEVLAAGTTIGKRTITLKGLIAYRAAEISKGNLPVQ